MTTWFWWILTANRKKSIDIVEHINPNSFIIFTQECPSGMVNEETFKHIYAQFFPHGGTVLRLHISFNALWGLLIAGDPTNVFFCVADASMYAHYLFNAFDTTNNGSIKFKVKTNKFNVNYDSYLHLHLESEFAFCLVAARTSSRVCPYCCEEPWEKSSSGRFTFTTSTETAT